MPKREVSYFLFFTSLAGDQKSLPVDIFNTQNLTNDRLGAMETV